MNEPVHTLITTADRSVKAITTATIGLAKVVADIQALTTVAETLAGDIQQKQSELVDLERQLSDNTRMNIAELNIRVAEAEETVLVELMNKRNLARLTIAERARLLEDRDTAIASKEEAISAAVQSAESALHAQYGSKLRSQESDFKVASAELVAGLRAVTERNAFLTDELVEARNELTAERAARIEIAKAEAGRQGVVVNAGKQ